MVHAAQALIVVALASAHVAWAAAAPRGLVSRWGFDGSVPEGATVHGTARFVSESDVPGAKGKALALAA